MSALDRWFYYDDNNDIVMVTENDGHTFLNRGPERKEVVIQDGHKYYLRALEYLHATR
jgi:hypothetical protein